MRAMDVAVYFRRCICLRRYFVSNEATGFGISDDKDAKDSADVHVYH